MIQWMHTFSKHWIVTLMMGALTLAFVVWGMGLEQFNIGGGNSVASVGGTEIGTVEFERTYRNFLRNQSQRMGSEITPDMAEKMGLADWQKRGMPDVAAVRHAMTVPELIDVPRNTSGMAISRYIPGQGLLDTAHRSYSKGVAGTSLGQWPDLVPFDVAAPTIAEGLAKKNAENLAAGKTTAIQPRYHMEKPTAGVPTSQVLDQEWLDRIMKFFEMKGR